MRPILAKATEPQIEPYHFVGGPPNEVDTVERLIVWPDGNSLEVISFARSVIAKWDELFLKHGIGA